MPQDEETEVEGKDDRARSVERQLAGTEGSTSGGKTESPADESPVRPEEVTDETPESPHGVGESAGRRGEDLKEDDGKEPGRDEGAREHESNRPTGTSDDRDASGT